MSDEPMEPGRELDALVSDAMGIPRTEWRYRCYVERHERDESWCYDCGALIGNQGADERIPAPYSTDIAAAFLVVEKLRADGWRFSLDDSGADGQTWEAWFCRDWDGESWAVTVCEKAASMEHAICLAALAALQAVAALRLRARGGAR